MMDNASTRSGFRGVSEVFRNWSSVFKHSKHRFVMVQKFRSNTLIEQSTTLIEQSHFVFLDSRK